MRLSLAKRWIGSALAAALVATPVAQHALLAQEKAPEKMQEKEPGKAPAANPVAPATNQVAPAKEQALPVDPVDQAIKKAVAFLYKMQKETAWEQVPRREDDGVANVNGLQWGGVSSMVIYALLAAGENPQDPRLARAIQFISKAEILGVYAMGMRLQIWNSMPLTKDLKEQLKKDATLMMNALKLEGEAKGKFHYALDRTKHNYDHSASNYGVLGMWAAGQQNLEIPVKFWEMVDKAWRDHQHKDGAWSYVKEPRDNHGPTNSMTAAGVATLFITQDMINEGKGGECKGNIEDENIARGMAWLSQHYKEVFGEPHKMYAMYNIERVGTASGFKYFGTTDWYKDGAEHLLKTQAPDGSWSGGHGPVIDTVYGILFLVKGRAPVMMNKLEYAIETHGDKGATNWNQRPRDIANLSRWAGKQLEKELNWQIVNLKVNVDDLHDAPLLYIAGNQVLNFSKAEKEKLRQYVEAGGMILGHADCNDQKFTISFTKLGQELFPAYEFRELPQDHLIYTAHFNGRAWGNKNLRGLTNGARELFVLIPGGDPAKFWQIRNFSTGAAKQSAELASNIFLYAADKSTLQGKFKGQSYIVKRDDAKPATQALRVARLEYAGNWNPEPGGWRRFANLMHNEKGIDLNVETVKLGDSKLKVDAYSLANLSGTGKFKLSEAARKEIKEFVEKGGTLLVEATGGSSDFKDAAQAELTAIFGPAAAKALGNTLSPEHPIYAAGGTKLGNVTYRPFAKRLLVGGMTAPRLRGLDVNGRLGVIYSAEDLSVGMVGMAIDGIYGYDPTSANELMERVVMHVAATAPKIAVGASDSAPAPGTEKPARGEEKGAGAAPAKPAPPPAKEIKTPFSKPGTPPAKKK